MFIEIEVYEKTTAYVEDNFDKAYAFLKKAYAKNVEVKIKINSNIVESSTKRNLYYFQQIMQLLIDINANN